MQLLAEQAAVGSADVVEFAVELIIKKIIVKLLCYHLRYKKEIWRVYRASNFQTKCM